LTASLSAHAETIRHKVTMLLICDIYEMAENRSGRGGLARIATVLKQERARNPLTIVAHAGDAISPSLMSSLDEGRHMMDLLGDLKLDVFVPGNHEFDFGPDVFKARMAEAGFPVLAGNVRNADGSEIAGIAPTRMMELARPEDRHCRIHGRGFGFALVARQPAVHPDHGLDAVGDG
jgi:5'-nucleotidase/UDP-sugar diphosphatase